MLTNGYVTLRLMRLRDGERWNCSGAGLVFLFPKCGAGEFASGLMKQRLSPGGILVVNSAVGGRFGAVNGGEVAFWHFSASLEHMVPLFAGHEICLLPHVNERFKAARVYAASSHLARECHKLLEEVPPQCNLGHRGQLLRIVAAILSEEFEAAQSKRAGLGRVEERMMQVFEELSAAELLDLSVAELAGKLSCSRRHLGRLFHQHFGCSVVALRMEMRLLKAVALLRDPSAKIIHVAEESGFHHLGLFHSTFKKRFGCSPGTWRRLNIPSAQAPAPPRSKAAFTMPVDGLAPAADGSQDHSLDLPKAALLRLNASPRRAASPEGRHIVISGRNEEQGAERRGQFENAL